MALKVMEAPRSFTNFLSNVHNDMESDVHLFERIFLLIPYQAVFHSVPFSSASSATVFSSAVALASSICSFSCFSFRSRWYHSLLASSSCRTSQIQEFSPYHCTTVDTGANDFHISFAQCSSVQLPSEFENDSRTPWVSFIKGS